MHAANVCHRDIKPSNIRLNQEGIVRFIDFGISKLLTKGPNTKNCDTRCYRPPEIFFGDREYTEKVDIWSAACSIYELITGKLLFEGDSDIEVVCKIFEKYHPSLP